MKRFLYLHERFKLVASSRFKPFARFPICVVFPLVQCNVVEMRKRNIMRLTDEMQDEILSITNRVYTLYVQYQDSTPMDEIPRQSTRLKHQHGEELESYKVKLENFYSDTDVKEQTF